MSKPCLTRVGYGYLTIASHEPLWFEWYVMQGCCVFHVCLSLYSACRRLMGFLWVLQSSPTIKTRNVTKIPIPPSLHLSEIKKYMQAISFVSEVKCLGKSGAVLLYIIKCPPQEQGRQFFASQMSVCLHQWCHFFFIFPAFD